VIFSNYASEDTQLPAVQAACAARGLPLDVIGAAAGRESAAPEAETDEFPEDEDHAPAHAPAIDNDDEPEEDFSDWNVPSWNDLIASLYRPDR